MEEEWPRVGWREEGSAMWVSYSMRRWLKALR